MGLKTRRKTGAPSSATGGRGESARVRWNVEQRLAFIEERLFWVGEINRNDLIERFDVSVSQASADIARYLELRPPGLAYDKSAKRYVAADDFQPVLAPPDADRFLAELRILEQHQIPEAGVALREGVPYAAAPLPERPVDPNVLRAVLRAIRHHRALNVRYQSMSRPVPTRRTIEPHALAYDGFRWHARAFDRESQSFRDFVLGRMSAPRAEWTAQSNPSDDAEWTTWVTLKIAPHPALTPAQSRAIALDYGIRGQSAAIRVRRSLLFYALKRLGLDVAVGARPPHEQHIVLQNREEIMAMSQSATEA